MSDHTKNLTNINAYNSQMLAHEVGEETKDSYYLQSYYTTNVQTGEITAKHTLVKNDFYPPVPTTGPLPGVKYYEKLFTGSVKECIDLLKTIIQLQGYWDNHPTIDFEKIFIKLTK